MILLFTMVCTFLKKWPISRKDNKPNDIQFRRSRTAYSIYSAHTAIRAHIPRLTKSECQNRGNKNSLSFILYYSPATTTHFAYHSIGEGGFPKSFRRPRNTQRTPTQHHHG